MTLPRRTTRLFFALAAVVVIGLVQAGSSAYRRYLQCRGDADNYTASEVLCRQKASVCEELSPKLRELASLARELAKSAASDFERSRWLEMARSDEEKATRNTHEAIRLMRRADEMASRAEALYRSSWLPWQADTE